MARFARQTARLSRGFMTDADVERELAFAMRTRRPFWDSAHRLRSRDARGPIDLGLGRGTLDEKSIDASKHMLLEAQKRIETNFDEQLDHVDAAWGDSWLDGSRLSLGLIFRESSLISRISERVTKLQQSQSLQLRVWATMEDPAYSTFALVVQIYILVLIVGAVIAFILESVNSIYGNDSENSLFFALEAFFVVNFTLEYCIRLLSCPDKRAFLRSPMNAIDVLAVAPFYVELVLDEVVGSFAGLRVLRLGRAARLLKLGRRSHTMNGFVEALAGATDTITLLLTILSLLMILYAAFVFYFETLIGTEVVQQHIVYTETWADEPLVSGLFLNRTKFQSVFHSMWWSGVTMFSVGYGDMVTITYFGKLFAAVAIFLAVLTLALPITFLGENFRDYLASTFVREGDLVRIGDQTVNLSGHGPLLPPQPRQRRANDPRDPMTSASFFHLGSIIHKATLLSLPVLREQFSLTRHANELIHERIDLLEHVIEEIELQYDTDQDDDDGWTTTDDDDGDDDWGNTGARGGGPAKRPSILVEEAPQLCSPEQAQAVLREVEQGSSEENDSAILRAMRSSSGSIQTQPARVLEVQPASPGATPAAESTTTSLIAGES